MQPLNELLNESYLVKHLNIKETDVYFSENLQKANEILAYVLNKLKETISYENYKMDYADVEEEFEDIIIKSQMFNKRTLRNLTEKVLYRHKPAPQGKFYRLQCSADYALISRITDYYRYNYKSADIIMELLDNSHILVKDGTMREMIEVFFDENGNVCYKINAFSLFQHSLHTDYNLFNERKDNISVERLRIFEDYGTFLEKRQNSLIDTLSCIICMCLPFAHKSTYTQMLNEIPALNSVLNPCYEFDMEVEI